MLFSQSVYISGIIPIQVQNLALCFVEPLIGLLLKPNPVPLDEIPSFYSINCTTQLGVICKLAEGVLNAIVYVIDKDAEEHQSQD